MGSGRLLSVMMILAIGLGMLPGIVRGDADGAQKYIEEAKQKIDSKDVKDAETSLKLAEAELDGIDAAAKAPIDKQIAAMRAQMADMAGSEEKTQLLKNIDYNLQEAKKSLSNKRDLKAYTDDAEKAVNSDDAMKMLDEATRKKYLQQIATYRKTGAIMSADADIARTSIVMDRVEEKFPEVMAAVKKDGPDVSEANNFDQDLKGLAKDLAELPPDNPKAKALNDRYRKMSVQFAAATSSGMNAKTLERLKGFWESYANEWQGWEQETTFPSFDEFTKESSESMSQLRQPKTVALVTRADYWLSDLAKNEQVKAAGDDPQMKALIDNVTKQRDAGVAKLVKGIEKVLTDAESAPLDKNKAEHLGYFGDEIRVMLNGAPQQPALQARAKAVVDKFNGGAAASAAAMSATLTKLTEQANAAWPAMAAKFTTTDDFDPTVALKDGAAYKGKYIRFKGVNNRVGWDFQPGGYNFAITRNGIPIAAKFDPEIRTAFADVQKKTGQDVPDENWDVIATFQTTGKIDKRVNIEAKIKGTNESVTAERYEAVDAPVLKIVAMHAGPVAAAVGQGAVSESGTVAPVAAASADGPAAVAATSAGGIGWFQGFLMLIVGLAAAGAALMKGKFAPLASVPQVGQVQAKIGNDNLAIIGLICGALGVLWMLMSLIHLLRGILVPLAIAAAGFVASLDFLVARGIVKPDLAAKVRPFAVPIGLACAAAVIVGLITRGALYLI